MEKYALKAYPQSQWKFKVYDNIDKLTPTQIIAKTKCTDLINLGYFALEDYDGGKAYSHQCAVMIDGKWESSPQWDWPGICVDKDGKATVGGTKDAKYDYIASVQADYIDNIRTNKKKWVKNGVSYTGFLSDGTLVAMISTKDEGLDSEESIKVMQDAGCVTVIRWDGSWSSRGRINGIDIAPSQYRCDRTWLLISKRDNKEEKPITPTEPIKKTVCIDPGHGAGSINCSPDKSYWEYEFAWDIYERMAPMLKRCGINVVCTRRKDNKPSMSDRVRTANNAKSDLVVSIHTNAVGSGKWVDTASGLIAFTYKSGENESQNKAARKILSHLQSDGIKLFSNSLQYDKSLTILAQTYAPAVLIEYGFHTCHADVELLKSSNYRQKLAVATTKGICDYLGIAFLDTVVPKPEIPKPLPPVLPWYAEDQKWAVAQGITDGKNPEDKASRAEVWAMLHRMTKSK